MFLQNMLKNTAQMGMAAPALRTVSSATAQGYLPQYRGSAAASLAPAMFRIPTPERDHEHLSSKTELPNPSADIIIPASASRVLPENWPLHRSQSPRLIRPATNTLGAEEYMRCIISQKADEDKRIIERGWNARTTATGPVMGSDW